MPDHEKEADQAKESTQQEGQGGKQGVPPDVVLATGLGVLNLLDSDEDEKREEKRWHEQREMDEAEARHEARKDGSYYRLDGGQPYVPKMPYPVPKDWDWRKVKREEEERRKERDAEDCGEAASERECRAEECSEEEDVKEKERRFRRAQAVANGVTPSDDFDLGMFLRYGERGGDAPWAWM